MVDGFVHHVARHVYLPALEVELAADVLPVAEVQLSSTQNQRPLSIAIDRAASLAVLAKLHAVLLVTSQD